MMKHDDELPFPADDKLRSSEPSAFSIEEGDAVIARVLVKEKKNSRLKKYMLVMSTVSAVFLIAGVLVATYSDLGWRLFGASDNDYEHSSGIVTNNETGAGDELSDSHSILSDNEIPTESSNAKKAWDEWENSHAHLDSNINATAYTHHPSKHEKGSHDKNRDEVDSNNTSDADSDNSNGKDTVTDNTNDMENSIKNEENSVVNNVSVSESSLGTWTENGINYEIIKEYPHDKTSFTQGLTYHNGRLFETTGRYTRSKVLELDPSTGKVLSSVDIPDTYFGEGVTYNAVNDTLIQVTWKKRKGFIYNPNDFSVIRTFEFSTYKNQGWGITQDPISNELIVSDGTEFLHFWDPETLEEKRRLPVLDKNGKPVLNLNELEFVHGRVFANVWFKDYVVAIDPDTGSVMEVYDFKDLFVPRPPGSNVLNGISITDKEDELFVTGKLWSSLFRVKIALPNN